jgi:hypothetical protein
MGIVLPVKSKHVHAAEQYPKLIKKEMDTIERLMAKEVQKYLEVVNTKVVELAFEEYKKYSTLTKSVIPDAALPQSMFIMNLEPLIRRIFTQAEKTTKSQVKNDLIALGIKTTSLKSIGIDFTKPYFNEFSYVTTLAGRKRQLADVLSKTTLKKLNKIIQAAIREGTPFNEVANSLTSQLGFNKVRADMIARTETNWYINEFQRQQLQRLGFKRYRIVLAKDACDVCRDAAKKVENRTSSRSCRCQLIGIIPAAWLKL